MSRILDAKYKNSNLNKVMTKQCQHLNAEERKRLLILLRKFEDLFDGTLDMWNTTLLELGLKDDAKPVCLQHYPVTRVHKTMSIKEFWYIDGGVKNARSFMLILWQLYN